MTNLSEKLKSAVVSDMLFEAAQMLPKGYCIVPEEPTTVMWGGLARDIVMWSRFTKHSGTDLYKHLNSIGTRIPDWLREEIKDTDHVPPKGTVAACIYKAMLEAYMEKH